MRECDVLILGGGAAGLMCALTAGQRGRQVQVLEHAERCGKKILMSGGGRCNFTNTGADPSNYLSANPHFAKSALARFTPADFIEMVERHGIAYHEKELGQLFCNESSKLIVRMLLDECSAAGVQIETGCTLQGIEHDGTGFIARTTRGKMRSQTLVIASGGPSIPRMGATGIGYQIARQFGHTVLPTRAGLVPLTLSGTHLERIKDLSGLSFAVEVACGKQSFQNQMLLTHRGISGPAILQISSYWREGETLDINLLPGQDIPALIIRWQRERRDAQLSTLLAEWLPKRFAQRLCEHWLENRPMRQFTPREIDHLAATLAHWPLTISGTEGYRTAEVTLGGVDTAELSSATLMSKRIPGLYFIGEVVDVTGWLGGYNFQWAWASGHAAGLVA